MSYYDEEIIIAGPDTKNLSTIKVNKIASGSGRNRHVAEQRERDIKGASASRRSSQLRQQKLPQSFSNDDDGLLQDIIDHDDEDDTDDSERQKSITNERKVSQRPTSVMRPGSSRIKRVPTAKVIDNDTEHSESGSDEGLAASINIDAVGATGGIGLLSTKTRIPSATSATPANKSVESSSPQLSITPEKWEHLGVHQEVKELFPHILKYTPQTIEIPFRLQPFIPEYVPAVGDVDAFLKVTTPPLLQTHRQHEINDHLRKLGLYILDEPSGEQSQPSLLNMKLRSVLTGSGVNPRLASASLIPTAKSSKDIDKWVAEVEQVHMTQTVRDVQPRKDIEPLLLDWPRDYAEAGSIVEDAYQRCLRQDISLVDYVRILSERFAVEGPLATQADYILNVHTLFALYLAANQAWE